MLEATKLLTKYFNTVTAEELPKTKAGWGGGKTLPGFNEKTFRPDYCI